MRKALSVLAGTIALYFNVGLVARFLLGAWHSLQEEGVGQQAGIGLMFAVVPFANVIAILLRIKGRSRPDKYVTAIYHLNVALLVVALVWTISWAFSNPASVIAQWAPGLALLLMIPAATAVVLFNSGNDHPAAVGNE